MVRVSNVSGQVLLVQPLLELTEVRSLKKRLQPICGVTSLAFGTCYSFLIGKFTQVSLFGVFQRDPTYIIVFRRVSRPTQVSRFRQRLLSERGILKDSDGLIDDQYHAAR